jgi:hypothetical protein
LTPPPFSLPSSFILYMAGPWCLYTTQPTRTHSWPKPHPLDLPWTLPLFCLGPGTSSPAPSTQTLASRRRARSGPPARTLHPSRSHPPPFPRLLTSLLTPALLRHAPAPPRRQQAPLHWPVAPRARPPIGHGHHPRTLPAYKTPLPTPLPPHTIPLSP